MKKIVAMREKKKNRTKALIALCCIMGMLSVTLGLVFFINPMEKSMTILGVMLLIVGSLMGVLIPIGRRSGKIIDETNSYPKEAVVIEDDTLYILTNKLIKIPLAEIKKVWCAREQNIGVFFRVIKSSGTLQIKTQTQSYKLYQITNVVKAKQEIKSYLKK